MRIFTKKPLFAIVFVLATALVLFPSLCPAESTFSVQITYAGAAGGVGLCFYFFSSFGSDLWSADIMPALMNVRNDKMVWGIPAIEYMQSPPDESADAPESYCLKLFRWEF